MWIFGENVAEVTPPSTYLLYALPLRLHYYDAVEICDVRRLLDPSRLCTATDSKQTRIVSRSGIDALTRTQNFIGTTLRFTNCGVIMWPRSDRMRPEMVAWQLL